MMFFHFFGLVVSAFGTSSNCSHETMYFVPCKNCKVQMRNCVMCIYAVTLALSQKTYYDVTLIREGLTAGDHTFRADL